MHETMRMLTQCCALSVANFSALLKLCCCYLRTDVLTNGTFQWHRRNQCPGLEVACNGKSQAGIACSRTLSETERGLGSVECRPPAACVGLVYSPQNPYSWGPGGAAPRQRFLITRPQAWGTPLAASPLPVPAVNMTEGLTRFICASALRPRAFYHN